MIELWIGPTPTKNATITKFACPYCGALMQFFSFPPLDCEYCDMHIPNVLRLKMEENYRVMYHIYGRNKV